MVIDAASGIRRSTIPGKSINTVFKKEGEAAGAGHIPTEQPKEIACMFLTFACLLIYLLIPWNPTLQSLYFFSSMITF